ncbi:LacI family DNA-binding transcriptional regulator [Chelativorans sp. Marseille-P2723]|uniref:LacI family DNA-binding transcriptional regulator n=1 Tax=Chelativorans sp. Marseille-P2723 TaxID=2709133 RepID=UPI00156E47D4|nr:LacI family DNA-binding transcriptional regulator [Chelativorans sp. Marseille-P2723]
MPRATLKDVAQLAGVSPMTVSNVVNGRMKGYNAETRDKVLWAVKACNYRPDIAARTLRTDRRKAVGMLIIQEHQFFLADPYITSLLDGLCTGLNQHGYSLVLERQPTNQMANSPLIQQRQSDGLCVLAAGEFDPNGSFAETLRGLGQPVILFQQSLPDPILDHCVIRQDDYEGGRMLAAHLIERGARQAVFILPQPDWPAMRARLNGARQEIEDSATGAQLTVITSLDESPDATEAALYNYMEAGGTFDAVMAGNDQMAIAVYRMLRRRGISVPDRVKLTGFNGFPLLDFFEPQLTTIRSPTFRMGNFAANLMIRRLEDGVFEPETVVLPVEFVRGETT